MSLVNLAMIEAADRPGASRASHDEARALLEAALADGDGRPEVRTTLAAALTNAADRAAGSTPPPSTS